MKVEIPRIRYGKSQEIETLISEEAFLLAQYLRNEKQTWIPRSGFTLVVSHPAFASSQPILDD
jgi:sensor domain CHASE-containing protein